MKWSTALWIAGGAIVLWFFVLPQFNPGGLFGPASRSRFRTGPASRPRFVGMTINPRTGKKEQVIAGPTLVRAR